MAVDWTAYQFLLGDWEGENTGDPGQGRGKFSFTLDLNQNILVRRSSTDYPASDKRPAFTHEDLLIIYTEFNHAVRAIYFDNEEHIIHYEVSASIRDEKIILTSDPVPSLPRFRFSYVKKGVYTVDASFEIAPPGQPEAFALYIAGSSRRVAE